MAEAELDFEEGPSPDAEENSVLSTTEYMTLEEVIRRRSSRAKRLMELYKAQYWGLVEEMRSKYRKFFLKHGKGGWKEDWEVLRPASSGGSVPGGGAAAPHPPGKAASETLHCAFLGCKSKPLALSIFCLAHILQEPRQQLYAPCAFVTKSVGKGAGGGRCEGQSRVERCGVPVLKAMRGPFCPVHRQQAAMHARAWRRSALGLGTLGQPIGKGMPKLHLILNEYVRAIQRKRRAHRQSCSPIQAAAPVAAAPAAAAAAAVPSALLSAPTPVTASPPLTLTAAVLSTIASAATATDTPAVTVAVLTQALGEAATVSPSS